MEKRGLGRGLAALIPESGGGERGGRVRDVPVDHVTPNPYQPRTLFDPLALVDLENSIREHGILQPILMREVGHERYQIVAGERRFRAACNVGLKTIPAIVRECDERELLEMAIVENVQREDISAMEAARAYGRMASEFGMTQEMISQRVGKGRSSVANTLRLLSLPESVQDSLERGEITEGHGRALMMAERPEAIIEAWKLVMKRSLSVRDTERLAKEWRGGQGADPRSSSALAAGPADASRVTLPVARDPHEAQMVEHLRDVLGTKVTLRHGVGSAGKIEIEYYSYDELERLLDLLTGIGGR